MSDSTPKHDKPFEAHITFDGKWASVVQEFAKADNGWSYSELLGDPVLDVSIAGGTRTLQPVKRCYLTAYGTDYHAVLVRMMSVVTVVNAPPMRTKIEFIVYDSIGSIDRRHNVTGYGL